MFEQIERVPGDAILGLIEAFKKDTNPQKVDLGVGVYRDAAGNTPDSRVLVAIANVSGALVLHTIFIASLLY